MSHVQLLLLSGFELSNNGHAIVVPPSCQRLLAFLAFQNGPVGRPLIMGNLWPEMNEQKAAACLRSTLWRVRRACQEVVHVASGGRLELHRSIDVDVRKTETSARMLINPGNSQADALKSSLPLEIDLHEIAAMLEGELLPDWYEDWVVSEREQLRQLRLHALELLCARLTDRGDHIKAIEVGQSAVAKEPLRESAHRALIAAHIAEGNVFEAVRQFSLCRDIFRSNLGLDPSQSLRSLITSTGGAGALIEVS
jgi:DNA-binding SARP family transcriptional activator